MNHHREQLEIFIHCRCLKEREGCTQIHPRVQMLMLRANDDDGWKKVGSTETISSSANPNFVKTIIVDYVFSIMQNCKFEIFDTGIDKKEYRLGCVETSLGAIVGSKCSTISLNLHDDQGKFSGKIILKAENTQKSSDYASLRVRIENIPNIRWMKLFQKTCPYLKFFKFFLLISFKN